MHTHDFPEVFWIESGQATHEINGVTQKLSPGDMVFIRPADRHQLLTADSEGFEMVNIAFPAVVLTDLLSRHAEVRALHSLKAANPKTLKLSPHQIRSLSEEVRKLASGPANRMAIERLLLGIYLLTTTPAMSPSLEALPDWLARACQEIDRPENFVEGVPAFTRLCGRSPEHVARSCRSALGKSPTDIVNAAKLNFAARELRIGTKTIIEISLESGFNNLAHFYELFKASQGETPRRYRLACQREVA
jgi:AraC family cel operon transcriptional repressor